MATPPQYDIADLAHVFSESLRPTVESAAATFQHGLRVAEARTSVPRFTGDNAPLSITFDDWLSTLNWRQLELGLDATSLRVFGLSTLGGHAAEFSRRLLLERPAMTWEQITEQLTKRFRDPLREVDAQNALKNFQQNSGEHIRPYGDRLLTLALRALPVEQLSTADTQRRLVDIFLDGLRSVHTQRLLLHRTPATLTDAIDLAADEHVLESSLVARRQNRSDAFADPYDTTEPMDISTIQHPTPSERLFREVRGLRTLITQAVPQAQPMNESSRDITRQPPRQQRSQAPPPRDDQLRSRQWRPP
ncbi:PREDICTED: uncharacterized protein LOC106810060, partial [Priapulus caudatus]|uniref:Uncharacterized protein LOC106810060 n=1 Tax=Priapulus caudatus TaxID=37621 RepID=A0ABM1E9D9_PRICU